MSLMVVKRAIETEAELPLAAWALLIAMAYGAKDDGSSVYASIGSLARLARMSRRNAFLALDVLVKAGIVVQTGRRGHKGKRFTIVYRIDLAKLEARSQDATESDAPLGGRMSLVTGCHTNESNAPLGDRMSPPLVTGWHTIKSLELERESEGGGEPEPAAGAEGQGPASDPAPAAPSVEEEPAMPRLVPVEYLSKQSRERDPSPEAGRLVERFLNLQGNPAYNERRTLNHWHAAFCRLLKAYSNLPAIMDYAFKEDPFWSDGKLIRSEDAVEHFEEKLKSKLASNYAKRQDALRSARERAERGRKAKASQKAALAAAAAPEDDYYGWRHRLPESVQELLKWGRRNENPTEWTKAYIRDNREGLERLPWFASEGGQEDLKWRRLI